MPIAIRALAAATCLVAASLVAGCSPVEPEDGSTVNESKDASTADEARQHASSEPEESKKKVEAKEPPSPEERALKKELTRVGKSFDGKVGIAVHDLQTGDTIHYNGRDLFPQQSVSKLWVALAALNSIDRGRVDLSDEVTIDRDDLTLFYQPIENLVKQRGSYTGTVGGLMERAITRSDNTANDAVLRRIGGPGAVRSFLARKGIDQIRFGPGERRLQSAIAGLEWDQSYSVDNTFHDVRDQVAEKVRTRAFESYIEDPIDGAAPAAIVEALARVAQGEIVSEKSADLLFDLLDRVKSGPNRLKGGVPAGWSIGHKTGTGQVWRGEQAGYNDVALLTAPDGDRYTVAVMIARTARSIPERMAMMHEVVQAVAEYHSAMNEGED